MALFISARLPPRRPGFDSRPGHVRLGTYSLGWRWPSRFFTITLGGWNTGQHFQSIRVQFWVRTKDIFYRKQPTEHLNSGTYGATARKGWEGKGECLQPLSWQFSWRRHLACRFRYFSATESISLVPVKISQSQIRILSRHRDIDSLE